MLVLKKKKNYQSDWTTLFFYLITIIAKCLCRLTAINAHIFFLILENCNQIYKHFATDAVTYYYCL